MTTDSETRALEEHLFSKPEHLKTAQAVYATWPAIRQRVLKRFLEHLHKKIKGAIMGHADFPNDIHVGCESAFDTPKDGYLQLFRTCWPEVERGDASNIRRSAFVLQIYRREPHGAWFGVESPHWNDASTDTKDEPRFSNGFSP